MKIVYAVIDHTNNGGMERMLATKANYFVEYGYEVTIVTQFAKHPDTFFFFDPRIAITNLNIVDDEKHKEEYLLKVSELLQTIKPDICISTEFGLGKYLYEINDGSKKVLEYHFSKYKGKPFLVDWEKYFLGRVVTDLYKRKQNYVAKQYDRFIILTHEDKKSWRKFNNIKVISNPIPYNPSMFSNNSSKRVIAVGRLSRGKAFERLIKMWTEVYSEFPDWELSIFGDGRRKKYLEELILKLKLTNVVRIKAPTSNIEKEYANSSIFAMTSRHEGQGLVILEGMGASLPIVTYGFRCGPRDMLIDGIDSFVIEEDNSKAFVEKMKLLMNDEGLRKKMGEKARENSQKYSIENIMPQWIQLFEELVEE